MSHFAHPTAIIEEGAIIGEGTRIWHFVHIRKEARIGEGCNIGKNVYIDLGVHIGKNVKIQNNVSIYHGVEIADGVFLGPHVCFTNDINPRAIKPDGTPLGETDWSLAVTHVGHGASIGANSTIRAGIRIGPWGMIGAGSVVTKDLPPYALAYGNPAVIRGVVAPSGEIVSRDYRPGIYPCREGGSSFEVPRV